MFNNLPWTRDDENRGKYTGTFGEVHVWKRIKNGKREMAVIKIPTVPQHIEKLHKERDKMLRINHRNIVQCLSPAIFGEDYNLERQYKSGIPWRDVLVMEFCDGGNLRKVFNQNKHGVNLEESLNICGDLGGALQYLHETHHIIHRDMKPENIFISKTTDPSRPLIYKVGDLGEVTEVMKSDGLTHVSTLQTHGTFAYMAPEQLLYDPYDGTMKMGESTDLWGLGTIISEAVYGLRPFFHDQGHHIHTDIATYCNSLLNKSDDTIHIYKEGGMRDANFTPIHCAELPHNATLPKFMLTRVNKILRSAFLSDRKKRGDNWNGVFGIYRMITDLTEMKICRVFDCDRAEFRYEEVTGGQGYTPTQSTEGIIIISTEGEVISPPLHTGLFLSFSDSPEQALRIPEVPRILQDYFEESDMFYKKGLERSLVGYILKLKLNLVTMATSVEVFGRFITVLNDTFSRDHLAPFTTLSQLQQFALHRNLAEDCRAAVAPDSSLHEAMTALVGEIQSHVQYVSWWVDTFRGFSAQTEWTDVYLLVDNFKEQYTQLTKRFSTISNRVYRHVRRLKEREGELREVMEGIAEAVSARTVGPPANMRISLLLEENTKLFRELQLELENIESEE